jgi:uncharacterized repeat protein (TIGR01451 family)
MMIAANRMKTFGVSFAKTACRFLTTAVLTVATLAVASLAFAPLAMAQATAPSLGSAQSFAVLGYSTVTNTGPSVVTGNLGLSPGSAVAGFPPGIVVGGTIYAADAVAAQARTDTGTAYVDLAGETCTENLTGTDLGGLTLTPGVYCFSSSAGLTGTLTLNAGGNAAAVWVFKIGSTLTTASNSSVVLVGGQPCNVFWQVGSSATLGTGTNFTGSILAEKSVTLTTDASLFGRALAQTGAVTLDANTVSITSCAAQGTVPPTLSKSFSPSTVKAGATSTLTLTLSNPDSEAATLKSALVDALPSGMTVAESGSTTCAGGAVNAAAGSSTVILSAGSIPANSSCTVTALITAAAGGNYINSLSSGALVTDTGSNTAPAIATLTVTPAAGAPPTLGKAFSPSTITAGGTSTLTLTLSNSGSAAASLTAPLIDTLPSGVTVSALGGNTCGGTVTGGKGSSTVTLTGGSIPADGSCTVTATVSAPAAGSYFNSLAAGVLQTSKGNSTSPAVATLTVTPIVPPSLSKSFSPATVTAGGTSTLTLTLSNSNTTAAALTAPLVDGLPSGMTVYGSGSTTCAGTVSAIKGSSTVTLTGGSIPASGHCTVTAAVTAPVAGGYVNTLAGGALQTSNGSNATTAVATLTVATAVPPSLSKSFGPATISAGGTSTLTITLSNANSISDSLSSPLVDAFPSGVTVSAPGSTTCGGTVTGSKGSSTVTLTGGSIPAYGSCTVTATVTAPAAGSFINILPIGVLKTSNGSNTAQATASLTVTPIVAPSLSKSFSPAIITAGRTSTLTLTLTNTNTLAAPLTTPLTDNLPSGMTVYEGGSTTCAGAVTAVKGSSTVTLTGGSIPASGNCTVTVKVAVTALFNNTLPVGALQTSLGSNKAAASASLTVN